MQDGRARIVWSCPWWQVEEREFRGPDNVERHWYTALRPNPDTVHTLAITPGGEVVLVHQWRVSMQQKVWELPAGIIDRPGEAPVQTAARELEEETGWRAGVTLPLFRGAVSSGLCNEVYNAFLCLELERVGAGGGTEGERLEPVLVPFGALEGFLAQREAEDQLVDCKILSHLYAAIVALARIAREERAGGNKRHSPLINTLAAQPYLPSRYLKLLMDADA